MRDLGKTIFLTTHYMEEAQALADRAAILVRGEIIAEGDPNELGGRAGAEAIISFRMPAGAAPADLPAPFAAAARPGEPTVSHASSDPLPELRALIDWADRRGTGLPGLEVRRPSLEDVYLRLTGEADDGAGRAG
jgi:ABC-2 type transport system ATP-binding protein